MAGGVRDARRRLPRRRPCRGARGPVKAGPPRHPALNAIVVVNRASARVDHARLRRGGGLVPFAPSGETRQRTSPATRLAAGGPRGRVPSGVRRPPGCHRGLLGRGTRATCYSRAIAGGYPFLLRRGKFCGRFYAAACTTRLHIGSPTSVCRRRGRVL